MFPPFNVGWGFNKIGSLKQDYWANDALGNPMIYMAWSSLAWYALVILLQSLDIGLDLSLDYFFPPTLDSKAFSHVHHALVYTQTCLQYGIHAFTFISK